MFVVSTDLMRLCVSLVHRCAGIALNIAVALTISIPVYCRYGSVPLPHPLNGLIRLHSIQTVELRSAKFKLVVKPFLQFVVFSRGQFIEFSFRHDFKVRFAYRDAGPTHRAIRSGSLLTHWEQTKCHLWAVQITAFIVGRFRRTFLIFQARATILFLNMTALYHNMDGKVRSLEFG